jgi:hypothetical protein
VKCDDDQPGRIDSRENVRSLRDVMQHGGRTSHGRSATDFALIESDTAERTETKSAAQSVLVGYLDSESSVAVGHFVAIKIQQRTEHDTDAKDSDRGESVAVRDFEVLSRGATQHGNGSNQGAH